MYEFAWRSPQFGGRFSAAHGVEMPFVFDTLCPETEPMLGCDPPQSFATAMHGAWVAFAVSNDCGWPKYDSSHRLMMRFDVVKNVISNLLAAQLNLWNGVR
jgi:para-nitrobenzyl esterase